MQLGETIATYDLALALRGESGKFDVTSPAGEIYHVTCKPNHSITNLQWSGDGASHQPFLVRKVAEPVATAPEKTNPNPIETTTPARVVQTPFLVSADATDSSSSVRSEEKAASAELLEASETTVDAQRILDLDVLYREGDSGQLTACVSLHSELHPEGAGLISRRCATFNEFDAEIRRLHAQLDNIRYQARKKFYQSQVVAAGA